MPPASVERFRAVYGSAAQDCEDVFRTGVWAPSLPTVRPVPSFVGDAATPADDPDCTHEMGKEKAFTGGTFGAFCTCRHPKCLGVIVPDGSESQRMPIEFSAQRCVTLPRQIVYGFPCAALKTTMCLLPFLALLVRF